MPGNDRLTFSVAYTMLWFPVVRILTPWVYSTTSHLLIHKGAPFASSAFASTGFDRHTSPVFSPANPDSSVEDCLAPLGEKAAQELRAPLLGALQTLLSR